LDSALKILNGSEKDVFVYRILLGYKFKDIAEILCLPIGTVFWIYQKAVAKIKKEVQI
jgi:DNA-directed RNA polymerase specialized sigma24 family protein